MSDQDQTYKETRFYFVEEDGMKWKYVVDVESGTRISIKRVK